MNQNRGVTAPWFLKLYKEMKKSIVFAMVAAALTIFNGCQKEELIISENGKNFQNSQEMLIVNDLKFFEVITVTDETSKYSVQLKISSNKKELLEYYLDVQEIVLTVADFDQNFENKMESNKPKLSVLDEKRTEEIPSDCVSFEVISENLQNEDAGYTLTLGTKKLKSYPNPPNTYYSFIKYTVRENAKINYFPNDTETDELYYKWAYTNSWLGKWYEDTYWRYVWGFDAVDSPMSIYHPLNHMGIYRLGIKIYYDDPNCFNAQSYK